MVKSCFLIGLNRLYIHWMIAIAILWMCQSGALIGAVINVGPPPASIQGAINSANDGDTIQLSVGTYVEEIVIISKTLDIIGAGQALTTIQAPLPTTHLTQKFTFGSNYYCVVMVDNQNAPFYSQTVNLSQLTVDGGTQQDTTKHPLYSSKNKFFGVGYHNASGTVSDVHITNMRQSVDVDELAGGGIINASDLGSVTFNITNCLVDFYQVIGIDCRGAALTANITNSTVNRGYTVPNSIPTPIGIQFSQGSGGNVIVNKIFENLSRVSGENAIGIFMRGAGSNIHISKNYLHNNDIGIYSVNAGENLVISENIIDFMLSLSPNLMKGIVVRDTNGLSTLSSNSMHHVPTVCMELNSSINRRFQLSHNLFNCSQTGLIVAGNTEFGPQVTMNADVFVEIAGNYIEEIAAPHDIWPSTATVTFDGVLASTSTFAQFNQIHSKIIGKSTNPDLGLVLDYVPFYPPVVSQVTPNTGPSYGGSNVTIFGANFESAQTQVYFGPNKAKEMNIVSDSVLTAETPGGFGVADVTVVTSAGISAIVPEDQYIYVGPAYLPPIVDYISPNHGKSKGGTRVKIEGEYFLTDDTFVYFGDSAALEVEVVS
ncbi:MAG: IPT/TIG domain-containing protein, partial [Parachlamydiaceae bacterium]